MLDSGVMTTNKDNKQLEMVEFKLGEKTFGVKLELVKEIIHAKPITAIPKSNPLVSGLVEIQGKAIPVINIEKVSGETAIFNPKFEKMIVIQLKEYSFVLRVEQVIEVRTIDQPNLKEEEHEFVTYTVERESNPLYIMDLDRIVHFITAN
ncbi:hypothetical protein GCM10008967_14330 [Bacillus carboniphilus]|uniref:CheW-like domain-containing protein n=2 Tax=Bacillus carboniphilus TaxID=86663 RepID=A0ABN0W4I0_9BACI